MNTIRKKDWENMISPHEAKYGAAEEGAAPGKPKMSKKEPPGKTGGSSYAGIALCSSRDT